MQTLNLKQFPILETENFLLRQFITNDIDVLFEIRNNPIAMQYIGRPVANTKEDAVTLFDMMQKTEEDSLGISWAIQYKDNAEMLGYIGFYRIDFANYRAEIGYTLNPKHFNKGIMQEAVKPVIAHGFNHFNFNSIIADISPLNIATIKLVKKHDFVQEAYFREIYNNDGVFSDSTIYTLLKVDWEGEF
jgi:[ribosomal protein S5]-alanine N-acetyltransferase